MGESLYLSGEAEEAAKAKQEEHREVSSYEGIVLEFLNREVPEDWETYKLDKRRMYWSGSVTGEIKTVPRQRVCALEVWCEALNGLPKDLTKAVSREINAVIERQEDWERTAKGLRHGPYGMQRGFIRLAQHSENQR